MTDLRYRLLGRSGLRVSELCLGTMTFGTDWGWGADPSACRTMLESFAARGGNFLDTANLYTNGSSEKILGDLIADRAAGLTREHWVIATKYTLATRAGDINAAGNHRKNLVHSLEASLRRLRVDCVDLLWVHADDGVTPVEEIMRALDDLIRAGKVLYIGVSDTPAWKVAQAVTLADLRGWSRFVALQIEYSLIQRTPEADLIPMAQALGLAVTPWGALGGGLLSGKYSKSADGKITARDSQRGTFNAERRGSDRNLAIADTVAEISRALDRSPSQVALAWLRAQPGNIIPILGARTPQQLDDNLAALDVTLAPDHLARLDAASRVPLGFPHDFLTSERMRTIIGGDVRARLDSDD